MLQKLKHSPRFVSVAVQTSPPPEAEAAVSTHQSSPTAPARTRLTRRGGVTNATADIEALVGQLSDAIDGFHAVSRPVQETVKSRKKPTDTSSGPPPVGPPPAFGGASLVPHSPQYQPAPESLVSQPSPNKTQPSFQRILRVEHECIR